MTDERHYKINTLEIGHIYIDNPDGEHMSWIGVEETLNKLIDENEQLKQYKQAVSDVLSNWSQKDLTAKQLSVITAIMKELNINGDEV